MIDRRLFLIGSLAATAAGSAHAQAPVTRLDLAEGGLVGRFHAAADARARPAVIMLNGSDGGIPSGADADDLAASGYPTLALAYFKNWQGKPDGLPASLNDIPLEYFFSAIDWLGRRPEVNGKRIVVMGQSRGGELALLLGSLRPDLAGVIAYAPSSRVWGGIPSPGVRSQTRPAWTVGEQPVPFQNSIADPAVPMRQWFVRAEKVEAARIRVERIRGPVLLVSGLADTVWPSDLFADEAAKALAGRPGRNRVRNLKFAEAGHLLMGTGPGMTKFTIPGSDFSFDFGGTGAATATARAQAWAASKRLLGAL